MDDITIRYIIGMAIGFFAGGLFGIVFGFDRGLKNGQFGMFLSFVHRGTELVSRDGHLSLPELVQGVADEFKYEKTAVSPVDSAGEDFDEN